MATPLAIYVHDHLAGAAFAIDLLETLRDQHRGETVGNFAAAMLIEVETDRTVLKRLADRVGSGSSPIKEAAAWLSEKVSRLKLGGDNDGLATFEALEFLALGVLGKLSLWKALREIAPMEGRLRDLDFATLIARALDQHSQLETHRLELAKKAFTNNSDS